MVILVTVLLSQTAKPFVHEPLTSYQQLHYQGFKVYVSSAARAHPDTLQPALKLLDEELQDVVRLVPAKTLPTLRRVPFFIENNNPDNPGACYHPSSEWLKQNGYNLAKTDAIEIGSPKNFVEWTKLNQPLMVLHELSHAYHELTYTFEDRYIAACYKNALASGTYESVAYNQGGKRRHYGLNNPQEYFAESSEAYFGENDFYPFNREQLKLHDPKGFAMIERMWGVRSP